MKVIIDTNILFSSLLSRNSIIRTILMNPKYHFFAPNFLFLEIFKHKDKIFKHTKEKQEEVYLFLEKSLKQITFVNESIISEENYLNAFKLCKNIDEKDTPFIALALEIKAKLWSGDKKIIQHLSNQNLNLLFTPETIKLQGDIS